MGDGEAGRTVAGVGGCDVTALKLILERQRAWAAAQGIDLNPPNYAARVEDNLFRQPSARMLNEFGAAAGQELVDSEGGAPAKMRALESSSALVVNVFEHLRQTAPQAIGHVLGITEPVVDVEFERRFPSGLPGTPPTLDVVITTSSGKLWCIESKFCEPYRAKDKRDPFASSYFSTGIGLWDDRGLPRCQELATALRDGGRLFEYLDAAQLLKHALGMLNQDAPATLTFLWYAHEAEATPLRGELSEFKGRVDTVLGFQSITYQDLFGRLRGLQIQAEAHLEYLRARYFS